MESGLIIETDAGGEIASKVVETSVQKAENNQLVSVINDVHKCDCLEFMPRIAAGSVDMVLCDLPYCTTQNNWDSEIPLDSLWKQYWRILKPNGAVVLTSQGIFTAKLIISQLQNFKYKWVWAKSKPTNFLNAKKRRSVRLVAKKRERCAP